MKKKPLFICALLCSLMLIIFAACSVSEEPDIEESTQSEETTSNTVRVTFPEGSTAVQIAQLLEENGVCSAESFLAEANNPAYLETIGGGVSNSGDRAFVMEGYIFPDTYDFYRGESASNAIMRFLNNFNRRFTDEMKQKAGSMGFTVDEILTLASIIQEEAGQPAEMPKVSSVLHNRLESPSFPKLQCDVATVYLRNYVKDYKTAEEYEKLVELYNTYNCQGLPAGPITNPGTDAINAALNPADTNYFYFVTDADMNYYYSSTWEEHQANCRAAGIYD